MEDGERKNTYIKDSNVEIIIANGKSQMSEGKVKETDYWPMIIIVVIIVMVAVYEIIPKLGLSRYI